MIKKFVVLILLPILITAVYLFGSDDNYVGVYALSIMLCGLFLTYFASKPHWGFLLAVVAMHWFQVTGMSATFYLVPVITFFLFLYTSQKSEVPIDKKWIFLILWTFGYMGLVFVKKPYPIQSAYFFINLAAFFLFLTSSLMKWDSRRVHVFLSAHLVFMIVWACIERVVSSETRVVGPTMSSTNFGVILVVAWTIWFVNGIFVQKLKPFTLAAMSFMVFVSILLSGTRMGILGMGAAMVLTVLCRYILLYRDQVVRLLLRFGIACIAVGVLMIGVWSILPDDLFLKHGMNTLLSGKLDASSMGRIGAWLTALDVIRTDTIWGIGPGNFLERNREFLRMATFIPNVDSLPRLGHAHNLFLMTWADQGIVGLIGLGGVVITCVWSLVHYIRSHLDGFGLALACGFIVMLCLGMIDVFPLFPSSLGWGAWFMSVLFSLRSEKKLPAAETMPAAEIMPAAETETLPATEAAK